MSNTKRRDNKGRVLQMGESQQDDGRYVYRYMTPFGQRKANRGKMMNKFREYFHGEKRGGPNE